MSTQAILSLRGLRKSFGDVDIIRGVDLDLVSGERHALIGPNGAGKSTLFHLISGRLPLTKGEIVLNGEPIQGLSPQQINHRGLARSFQITNIFAGLTVFENLRLAVMQRHGLQYTLWKFAHKLRAVRDETQHLLEQVRLAERAQTIAGELSYSEQRSLEIAMTLASDPKVIMLDEPMAGMSQEETDYTAALIREIAQGRTLLIVEHDMDVVFSLSDRISVLVYGEIVATGTPDEIRNNARVKEAYLGEEVTV
ncbi:ABC transporter-like protein [Cupriavidus basilensis OR16]|uniref:ABC transporter-like protein n=1 Tax=Cupriavidus basilensis OR16 TaxID=1127483 RepID=H1S5G8_9BURK|nr:ABC transporter ATP-binding protein [Cupriavidus basilensis]EHP42194.1 ABC transporter-like protein [Cupriavidus basilensis OR16]